MICLLAIVWIFFKKLGNLGKHIVLERKYNGKAGKPGKIQWFAKKFICNSWETWENTMLSYDLLNLTYRFGLSLSLSLQILIVFNMMRETERKKERERESARPKGYIKLSKSYQSIVFS